MSDTIDVLVRIGYSQKRTAKELLQNAAKKWDRNTLCGLSLFVNNYPPQETLIGLSFDQSKITKADIMSWVQTQNLTLEQERTITDLMSAAQKGKFNVVTGPPLEHALDHVLQSIWFN
jgi:hypothetical protein